MHMSLSDRIKMLEEWLAEMTYSYRIVNVRMKGSWDYVVTFWEYTPDGTSFDEATFIINSNGRMINENGDDVGLFALDIYSMDKDMCEWIRKFNKKWRVDRIWEK